MPLMRTLAVTFLITSAAAIGTIALLPAHLSGQQSGLQQPFTGTPELELRLRQLNELGTVLMIAAHPDDEPPF